MSETLDQSPDDLDAAPIEEDDEENSEPSGVGPITPSVLILVNLLPILGVFLKKWGAFDVLRLYWFEFALIGVFCLFRMLFARVSSSRPGGKPGAVVLYIAVFLCSLFMFGLLTIFLFGREPSALPTDVVKTLSAGTGGIFWGCVGALGVSHLISFFLNYMGLKEIDWMRGAHVIRYPFIRAAVTIIACLVLGLLCHAFRSPAWAVIAMIVIKTVIDLRLHFFVHRPGQSSGRRRRVRRSTQTVGLMN